MSRSLRLMRISPVAYPVRFTGIYDADRRLEHKSYAEQQRALFDRFHVYFDSLTNALQQLGYECFEIVSDVEPIQRQWAKENDLTCASMKEIMARQIETLKPDVLFFQDVHSLGLEEFQSLKTRFPFVKLVVIFRGSPILDDLRTKKLACADVLCVGSPLLVEKCRASGMDPVLWHHYFDPRILAALDRDGALQRRYDFTFSGASGYRYGAGYHTFRYKLLVELMERTPLRCWVYELSTRHGWWRLRNSPFRDFIDQSIRPRLGRALQSIKGRGDGTSERHGDEDGITLPLIKLRPDRCHRPEFGLDMYALLAQSRVTFNVHTHLAGGTVDNFRLFQATGVGTCLLTDTGSNLHDLFEPDREVVTYSTIDECVEKATYLLAHDEERESIARAGQARTLRDHTASKRAERLDELIQERLG